MAQSDSLREALRHSPDNVPLLLLFAQACLDEWNPGEARQAYERVLERVPDHREAMLGLARTLFLEGRNSAAAVRIEEMLSRDPNFAAAHVLLSRVLLAEGAKEEAITHYQQAVALDKGAIDQPLASELGIDPSGNSRDEGRGRSALGAAADGSPVPRPSRPRPVTTRMAGRIPKPIVSCRSSGRRSTSSASAA